MFVVVPALTLRWIVGKLRPRIATAVRREAIVLEDLRANSLGLTSRGMFQSRGNGGLVLTADELLFFQVVPRRDLAIPLSAIHEVKSEKAHLGKSYGRDLLYVAFDGPSGPDSIAWFVRDLPAWLEALRRAASGNRAAGSMGSDPRRD
ncbi:MAG: hypothetical protein KIT43_05480 [Bauldia sp.]|nr:hypothetical protein [Bauldia sp.]